MKTKERISSYKGDIFVIKLKNGNKRYFQYITTDMTQLNSSVIRVFKKEYNSDYGFNAEEVISDDVDFYAHTMINPGQKLGCWEKVGKNKDVGIVDIWFKTYHDGALKSRGGFKKGWYKWSVNKDFIFEKNDDNIKKMPLGGVYPPIAIINKINTGLTGFKTIIDGQIYELF